MPTQLSDIELVAAMQQHDEMALSTLYERYFDKLYKYFYFRVYDEALAQDLNADTWMHIFEKIATFDPTKSTNVSGRLYRIAHNKLVDHRRTHHKEYQLQEDRETVSYHPDLLAKTDASMLVSKLLPIIEDIHPHAKDILLMKIWEGMSHAEIAQQLDISIANSKKIYSRTLKHLQDNYGELATTFIAMLFIAGTTLTH